MSKLTLNVIGILFVGLFSTAALFAQAEYNDSQQIVRQAYDRIYGRPPQPKEIDNWMKILGWQQNANWTGTGKQKLENELRKSLSDPNNEKGLFDVIRRSYQRSFGRDPKPEEVAYWKKEIYAKNFVYADLMNYHRQWLKSDNGKFDRSYAITQGYLNGIGRAPNGGDMSYWQEKIQADGSNYTDVLNANINFILQSGNHQEFAATVKRAYATAKLPAPGASRITEIRLRIQNKPMVFAKLVEFVKNYKGTTKID